MSEINYVNEFEPKIQKGLEAIGVATSHQIKKITKGDLFGYELSNINNHARYVFYNQEFKKQVHLSMEKGATLAPVLFGPLIHKQVIWCTEGETDAIQLSNHTSNIISFPGANGVNLKSLGKNFSDHFSGNETFAIVFDNDPAGKNGAQSLKKELLDVLPNATVKVLDLSTLSPNVKDIKEGLHHCVYTFEDLKLLCEETPGEGKESWLLEQIIDTDIVKPKLPIAYDEESGTLSYSVQMADCKVALISSSLKGKKSIIDSEKVCLESTFEPENHKNLPNVKGLKRETLKNEWNIKQNGKDLYKKIKSIFHKLIYFKDHDYLDIHVTYVLMTYLYPIFPRISYLHINGNKHCGKSQLSRIHADLDFNAQESTSSTMAAIRRVIHHDRGTIILDDWEKAYGGEHGDELISMLNSGYDTNSKSVLTDKDTMVPKAYFTGGPKIFNSINKIDPVLASRCIISKMYQAPNDFIRRTPPTREEIKELRTKILLWALENHAEVRKIFCGENPSISREEELYKPLEAIAKCIQGKDSSELKSIQKVKTQHKELQGERLGINEIILDEIYYLWSQSSDQPPYEFECSHHIIYTSLLSRDDLPSSFHKNQIKDAIGAFNMCLKQERKIDKTNSKITVYTINVPTMISAWRSLSKCDVQTINDFS